MMCIEWWSFEIAAFVTGSINKTELGVHAVLISLLSVVFMVTAEGQEGHIHCHRNYVYA